MPTTEPSKFAENQILSSTVNRYPLMSELLADTVARTMIVTSGIAEFGPVVMDLTVAAATWTTGASAIANAEAAQLATTHFFDTHMASLTRQPDGETNSVLETWDNIIRSQVPYQGGIYTQLLPAGRETLTTGSREQQLEAIHDFGQRLALQTTKPALVTLGTTVAAFAGTGRTLRTAQTNAKSTLEAARQAQEALRVAAANAIYAVIGQGMVIWKSDPLRVDTLWDVNILRNPPQAPPAAPADTTWDAATRTLAASALPESATRLEAWRLGPGGTPELLVTAGPGSTTVIIPANITFSPGALYQLWLVALNGKGRSEPGPVQSWTAA